MEDNKDSKGHNIDNTPRRMQRRLSDADNNQPNKAERESKDSSLGELGSLLEEKQGENPEAEGDIWDIMGEEKPKAEKQDIFSYLDRPSPAAIKGDTAAVVKKPRRQGQKHPVLTVIVFFFGLFVSICLSCMVFLLYSTRNDDLWLRLEQIPYKTSTIIYHSDESGNTGVYFEMPCTQDKIYTPPEKIPKYLLDAFVAVEDRKFYSHIGTDFKRTTFAIINEGVHAITGSYIGGDSGRKQGASTINQQLVKNLTRDDEADKMAGYLRKIKEIYRAVAMDINYSKEDILYAYVNTISFTGNTAGAGAEARKLFNKELSDLSLAQCAGLAGITRNPSRYSPVKNPEEYLDRRNYVLSLMLDEEYISREEYEQAVAEDIGLNYQGERPIEYPVTDYFTDMLIESLVTELKETRGLDRTQAINLFYNGGLRIYATVDLKLQSSMEAVAEGGGVFKSGAQAAMISLDYSGRVKGVVGGTGKKEVSLGLNRAVSSTRQVGSTMKPIGPYVLAIEKNKINWSSPFMDSPVSYTTDAEGNETGWPKNANGAYSEKDILVRRAVAKSVNTVAVRVGELVGEKAVYDFVTEKLGISSLDKKDIAPGPLFLGSSTYGISPAEMAKAYTMFGNGGKTPDKIICFDKISDGSGYVLLESQSKMKKTISQDSAYVMNRLLKAVMENGTAEGYSVPGSMDSVGKTGTTNDGRDYWFIGLTPYYVTAVWYGNDDGSPLDKAAGEHPPILAWQRVMAKAQEGLPVREFPKDESVIEQKYCTTSGLIPQDSCPKATGYYRRLNTPSGVCPGGH